MPFLNCRQIYSVIYLSIPTEKPTHTVTRIV